MVIFVNQGEGTLTPPNKTTTLGRPDPVGAGRPFVPAIGGAVYPLHRAAAKFSFWKFWRASLISKSGLKNQKFGIFDT